MRKQIEALENHSDFATNAVDVGKLIPELDTIDDDAATVVPFDVIDAANEGRFAGSGRSADDDFFPFPDSETYRIQGGERAVSPDQSLDHDDRLRARSVALGLQHDFLSAEGHH